MKNILTVIYASFLLAACSSNNDTKLQKQVNVPGTHLLVALPEGYSVSKKFTGIEKNNGAGILIYDLEGGNYETNAKDMTRSSFESRGGKVFDFMETKVDNYNAKFIHAQGDPSKSIMTLVFGDTSFSCMLMAAFPPGNDALAAEIKNIMLHVQYDKKIKIDPFEIAAFTLDTTGSGFGFSSYNGGMYVYSLGGKKQPQKKEPVLVITQVPSEGILTAKDAAKSMILAYQQKGFFPVEQPVERTVDVDGVNAYETFSKGVIMGDSVLFYQLATLKNERIIVFQGISKANFSNSLEKFKELGHSIRLK